MGEENAERNARERGGRGEEKCLEVVQSIFTWLCSVYVDIPISGDDALGNLALSLMSSIRQMSKFK